MAKANATPARKVKANAPVNDKNLSEYGSRRNKHLFNVYAQQKQVEVSISPMYEPYLGKVMPISINGLTVFLPIDGRTYKLPKSFASEAIARRRAIDIQRRRADTMADVTRNKEQNPGELKMV